MNSKQIAIINWLGNNPGPHTSEEVALGVGFTEPITRVTLSGLTKANDTRPAYVKVVQIEREVLEQIVSVMAYELIG